MKGTRESHGSRRQLDSETARAMVRVREAWRAYRRYHATCFWSYRADLLITAADVPWVAGQLRKHGGCDEWDSAARLCL